MSRQLTGNARWLLAVVLVAGLGCANTTAFVITDQTLAALDDVVELVHQHMVTARAEGVVTADKVRVFNAWLDRYQAVYPVAVQLAKAGRRVNDAAVVGKATEIVAALIAELGPLAAVVGVSVAGLQGATP